jgi:hypothetical protein
MNDDEDNSAVGALERELQGLYERRDSVRSVLGEVESEIQRREAAMSVLRGEASLPGSRAGARAQTAVMAALRSFDGPVSTQTLLDHPDLVHYSRNTLRSALSAAKQGGRIQVHDRTPHGYIWEPL